MEYALLITRILFQFILIVIVVDFVGGAVHWAEDTFWTTDTPIVGKWLVAPNIIHHTPDGANYFMRHHWAHSSWDLLTAASLGIGVGYFFGINIWQFYAFIFVGVFSQQVHRFSHSSKKNPFLVTVLQKLRIIQDRKHHWGHHSGDKNTRYCVITPWVNPVLDRLHFWRGLERLLVPILKAPRREDIHRQPWYSMSHSRAEMSSCERTE